MTVDPNSVIPKDSKKIKTEDISDDILIKTQDTYNSTALKESLKNDGSFVIITQYDKKSGNYLSTTISATLPKQ